MSTLTPGLLTGWDAAALGSAARALRQDAAVLREVEVVVRRAVEAVEVGRGRTADATRRQGLADALLARRVAEQVELDAAVVQAASEVVGAAVASLARATRLAASAGLRVGGDGRVDPGPEPEQGRVGLADTCSAMARQALAAAEEADADAARALDRRAGVRGIFATLLGPLPGAATPASAAAARVRAHALPEGASVADRAGWWQATPVREQGRLRSAGGTDLGEGLPPSVRDAGNRARLSAELVRVQRLLAGVGRRPTPTEVVLLGRLRVLLSVQRVLSRHPDARLLTLDSATGTGRAVVAFGDLDRADHVAVLVPGLSGWVPHYLEGLSGDAQRVRVQAAGYGNGSVATVAWIGYQAPNVHNVALRGAAERGVPGLRRTLDALEVRAAARGREQTVTLLGHSYGSMLSGLATREPTGIDDLVLLGSPGAAAHRTSELSVPAGHVWVGEARFDPVADLGRFGADPSFPTFGATTLPTGAGLDLLLGTPVASSTGHSEYYAAGSAALASVGLVVAGRGGLLRPGSLAPGPSGQPSINGSARPGASRTPR